eukprot:408087_1
MIVINNILFCFLPARIQNSMDPRNDESLPEVEVLTSLDELSSVQKCRFFEYLNNCIGTSSGEIWIMNAEMIRNWGTVRMFVQKISSGPVAGAALLVKSGISGDSLVICGLCYNGQFSIAGQRLLKSIVSTWEQDFSNCGLSVELSKDNEFIQRVALDLGFTYDKDSSEDSWPRFMLSARVKTESDSNTNELCAEIDIRCEPESSTSSTHSSSISGHIRQQFPCESCDKTFTHKYNLNRHTRDVHEKIRQFSCESCDKTFTQKCYLKIHINTVHEKLCPFACELCDKKFG